MKSPFLETIGLVEVSSDGTTVWVNGANGWCVGRFSASGILYGQSGETRPGPLTAGDWKAFRARMIDVHGVKVSDRHTPNFLKVHA